MNLWRLNLPLYFKQVNLCSVWVTEFASVLKKQIFSVTVTELDFVFYNKTVKDISKNVKN